MGKKNGFTLIELLVVISILGVLSVIAVVVYTGLTARARDSQRIRDLQFIKQALELYRSDVHNYPPNTTYLDPTYLSPIPSDKTPRIYYYSPSTDGLSFTLCAKKESSSITDFPACTSFNCGAGYCDIGISSQ